MNIRSQYGQLVSLVSSLPLCKQVIYKLIFLQCIMTGSEGAECFASKFAVFSYICRILILYTCTNDIDCITMIYILIVLYFC